MLLFVALGADDLPLRAAARARATTAALGLLWAALDLHRAARATRAFVPEREQGMFDALVLAPCDRSAIWLGKALACSRSSSLAEVVALPAFAAFFSGVDWRTVAAVALADIGIAPSARCSARWPSPAARASCSCRCSSCRSRSRSSSAASARASRRRSTSVPRAVRRDLRRCSPGRAFEYVVAGDLGRRVYHSAVTRARASRDFLPSRLHRAGLFGLAIALIFFYAPTDADQGFSQRIFYFHVPIALRVRLLRLGRLEGAAATLARATSAPTSRATSRSTRA